MTIYAELENQIIELLKQANLSQHILSLSPCLNGGNNRTYKIETEEGSYIVKKYFKQSSDQRDRLNAEFSFLKYANQIIPERVPTPFSKDIVNEMALYEWLQGVPLHADTITQKEVNAAADFFCSINQSEQKSQAYHLSSASEACFNLQAHLDLVQKRISGLQEFSPILAEDYIAKLLIDQLSDYWQNLMTQIIETAQRNSIDLVQPLTKSMQCISPSDFGFHNALKKEDDEIVFLDFEYAGWDDPAKMVGDFFAQIAIPVPHHYFDFFVERVMQPFPDPNYLIQRAHLLRSVYQVKWCCIALNIFIPMNLARRQFAHPELNVVDLKRTQLEKATTLLKKLEPLSHGNY